MTAFWQWDVQSLAKDPNSDALIKSLLATTPAGWVMAMEAVDHRKVKAAGDYERHGSLNDGLDSNFWVSAGTKPGLSSDHHLLIRDEVTGRTQDMWEVVLGSDGKIDSWRAGRGYPNVLSEPYVPPPIPGHKNQGTNASNVPAWPSLIWPSEIEAGIIDHTLRFVFHGPAHTKPRYPASPLAVAYPLSMAIAGNPPLGVLIRMNKTATIPSTYSRLEHTVLNALKSRGAVGSDGGSDLSFKAADLRGGGQSKADWDAVGIVMDIARGGVIHDKAMPTPQLRLPWHLLEVVVLPVGA